MPSSDAFVTALWIIHTYVFDLFICTPRLCVSAPEKRCGKTTLLDVIAHLVNRPLLTVDITGPAIFRTVEKWRPTVLLDEADNLFGRNGRAGDGASDILPILNSGHRRGGQVTRTVGDDFEPRTFSTHAPAVIALIQKAPSTLEDRSIHIRLRRKHADEQVERFRADRVENLQQLARQIRRWCDDNRETLVASDPEMPRELFNRDADNWGPLLAIADATGFGDVGRTVAIRSASQNMDDEGLGVMLLADIRLVFEKLQTDMLPSEQLVNSLVELEGRPWSDCRRGECINKHWLVRVLKPFRIGPEPEALHLPDGTRRRGYRRSRFNDAFARYLPPLSV
jgi:hypothetical protein